MIQEEFLILVDEHDQLQGKMEKLQVHQAGLLHRAFSVFIFNSKGELLLQQRAEEKYHSGGLWSNTCCSHPRYGEEIPNAIDRRLSEEMGLKCKTQFAFSFIYKVDLGNGLTEHEYDHVYFGVSDDVPKPEKSEVKDWKYVDMNTLKKDLQTNPQNYSYWLSVCFDKVMEHFPSYASEKNLKI